MSDEKTEKKPKRSDDPEIRRDQVLLGKTLAKLRKDIGITQEELAFRLDVYPTFIGRLERGERDARWHTIRKVLHALEMDPSDFAAALQHHEDTIPY